MRLKFRTVFTMAVMGLLTTSLALSQPAPAKANNVSDSNALARDAVDYAKDYGVTKAQALC